MYLGTSPGNNSLAAVTTRGGICVCIEGFEDFQDSKMRLVGFEEGIRGIRVCVRGFGDSQDVKMRFIGFEEGIRSRDSRDSYVYSRF
jgi:hypothetical protein